MTAPATLRHTVVRDVRRRIWGRFSMSTCEVCGNEYDKTFEVRFAGENHVFDSFECAIYALAPTCNHCSCRIVGHGVENEHGVMFCCANCAKLSGVQGVRDRAS